MTERIVAGWRNFTSTFRELFLDARVAGTLLITSLFTVGFVCSGAFAANVNRKDVRLVVLVVVDQLRGDFLDFYEDRFEKSGGFQRFLSSGTVFEQAFQDHSVTLTGPGHASIVTGTNPSYHGIVGNDWFDRKQGHRVNAVYDFSETIVGTDYDGPGRSPRLLRATTLGDEMVMASGGLANVLTISGKDRSAVLTAGRLGTALWYFPPSGSFVSSSYYLKAGLPDWAKSANDNISEFVPANWSLLLERDAYRRATADDRPSEVGAIVIDAEFPHDLPGEIGEEYYWSLKLTPFLDQKTLEFSKAAIVGAGLGSDATTDLLVVSLSSTDYIGHYYGWYSLEAEDNIIRLDRALGKFFADVDDAVGPDKTLFVLTSDHGTDAIPAYKRSLGMPAYRLVDTDVLDEVNRGLSTRYAIDDSLLSAFIVPNMYIDRAAVERNRLSFDDVQRSAILLLEKIDGIESAIPVGMVDSDVDAPWHRLVGNSVFPERSGDIYIVQSHSTYMEWAHYTAAHGSPHQYDRHVPLMFSGPEINQPRSSRRVTIPSLAPTIATYIGAPVPAYAVGVALPEITASAHDQHR